MNKEDIYFAAIEDWMIPILTENSEAAWDLNMIQFILPKDVRLPKLSSHNVSLTIDDAPYVYSNSEYQDYFSVEYIRDRIARGPSIAVYEKDRLVAWAMTQDDGAMGALHVLESHRIKAMAIKLL